MCLMMQNTINEGLEEMATIGERIKLLRKAANMTQDEFGSRFGIVKSTVSLYENGKSTPNDEIKKKICEYFSVSMDYLLGIDSPPVMLCSPEDRPGTFVFTFGNRDKFNSLISKKGLNLHTLSQKTGISEETLLSMFESHTPTLRELVSLSDALDVSLDELLDRQTKPLLGDDEQDLLLYYRQLTRMDKQWIIGKMLDILKNYAEPVAADPAEAPSGKMAK